MSTRLGARLRGRLRVRRGEGRRREGGQVGRAHQGWTRRRLHLECARALVVVDAVLPDADLLVLLRPPNSQL